MGQELAGKVAIVTGGASGIGYATVVKFVEEGAKVVIADLNVQAGEALAKELGSAALFQRTDVSKADEVQALVDAAVTHFGGLHVMFNNAGMPSAAYPHFLDDPLDDFDQVLRVNLLGVMLGTQRAARHMKDHGGGSIINNASIAGVVRGLALMTYRASKAGMIHFSRSVAIDLAQYNIRVNSLAPGHIRTGMTSAPLGGDVEAEKARRVQEALQPVWDSNKPLKRQGLSSDVAEAVLFLAGDRSAMITGVNIPVDGGISIGDPVNHLAELRAAQAAALAV